MLAAAVLAALERAVLAGAIAARVSCADERTPDGCAGGAAWAACADELSVAVRAAEGLAVRPVADWVADWMVRCTPIPAVLAPSPDRAEAADAADAADAVDAVDAVDPLAGALAWVASDIAALGRVTPPIGFAETGDWWAFAALDCALLPAAAAWAPVTLD